VSTSFEIGMIVGLNEFCIVQTKPSCRRATVYTAVTLAEALEEVEDCPGGGGDATETELEAWAAGG
jgi:hypothetical protein